METYLEYSPTFWAGYKAYANDLNTNPPANFSAINVSKWNEGVEYARLERIECRNLFNSRNSEKVFLAAAKRAKPKEREAAINLILEGTLSSREIANSVGLSYNFVNKIKREFRHSLNHSRAGKYQ